MPPPSEPADVSLGEVFRGLEKLVTKVEALSEQIGKQPTWRDLDRMADTLRAEATAKVSAGVAEHAPLEARVTDLESADAERQREARTTRGQMVIAVVGAGLSLVVTLLAVVLTGR